MTVQPVIQIEIFFQPDFKESVKYNYCHSVKCSESFEKLTKTATVTLPQKAALKADPLTAGIQALFKRGDKINISIGYMPDRIKRFSGYISNVVPAKPFVIQAEDEMWLLKQITIPKYSKSSLTLLQLLTDVLPTGTKFKCLDCNLGAFRVSNATIADILKELHSTYGLFSFYKDGTLLVGLAYYPDLAKEVKFIFEENMIRSDDEETLVYKRIDDVKIKLTAISIFNDNTKIHYETGDAQGEQRTKYYYEMDSDSLKKLADAEVSHMRYEGFYGKFLTYGQPIIQQGDRCSIISKLLPERNGIYLTKSVDWSFDDRGYRQEVYLEQKIINTTEPI